MQRILVVEDEPAVRDSLERALRLEGLAVSVAADGREALEALALEPPVGVILDVGLPVMDGLEVCRRMRAAGDRTPVLMLTARDAVDDRVEGLDAGADDYLVKPFALRELLARVRALLRRAEPTGEGPLAFGDLRLDAAAHTCHRGQREIELTKTEMSLLELFMRHPRQVLTRTQIYESVWGYDFGASSNSLGVYIGYLRAKTEAGGEPRLLQTVRGVGYALPRAQMSLRRRMTLIAGASVGVAIALASLIAYLAVRSELRGQVDDRLRDQGALVAQEPVPVAGGSFDVPQLPPEVAGGPPLFFRLTGPDGDVIAAQGPFTVPLENGTVPVPGDRAGDAEGELFDADVNGTHLRVISVPTPYGGDVQIGRSLESVDDALSELTTVLILIAVVGIGLSALGARWVAGRMLLPVAALTGAAEHIAETDDLSRRIDVGSDDEVGMLASRFNQMLDRLQASRSELAESHDQQRRLIADASHELRTPITSLRTNLELLAGGRMGEEDRARALNDAVAQSEELGDVVAGVMDLARGEAPAEHREPVRLDELVRESVERARRHSPATEFVLDVEPAEVEGAPDRLSRAINNLLDNAVEHAGDGPIEVKVRPGTIRVRDHGAGIEAGELDKVFDRFYRGRDARSRPGSGLGLAIVRQIVESHGGSVSASATDDGAGGASFEIRLPG